MKVAFASEMLNCREGDGWCEGNRAETSVGRGASDGREDCIGWRRNTQNLHVTPSPSRLANIAKRNRQSQIRQRRRWRPNGRQGRREAPKEIDSPEP